MNGVIKKEIDLYEKDIDLYGKSKRRRWHEVSWKDVLGPDVMSLLRKDMPTREEVLVLIKYMALNSMPKNLCFELFYAKYGRLKGYEKRKIWGVINNQVVDVLNDDGVIFNVVKYLKRSKINNYLKEDAIKNWRSARLNPYLEKEKPKYHTDIEKFLADPNVEESAKRVVNYIGLKRALEYNAKIINLRRSKGDLHANDYVEYKEKNDFFRGLTFNIPKAFHRETLGNYLKRWDKTYSNMNTEKIYTYDSGVRSSRSNINAGDDWEDVYHRTKFYPWKDDDANDYGTREYWNRLNDPLAKDYDKEISLVDNNGMNGIISLFFELATEYKGLYNSYRIPKKSVVKGWSRAKVLRRIVLLRKRINAKRQSSRARPSRRGKRVVESVTERPRRLPGFTHHIYGLEDMF